MIKRLIIIGGGFAGSMIAKRLQYSFRVTLIDNKNYFEFTPGILKSIVYPRMLKNIEVMHKDYLKNVELVIGDVKKITEDKVILKDSNIEYDYLVIASGSKYKFPIKGHNAILNIRGKDIIQYSNELKNAKDVLIIGGGIVGIELAAEISDKYNKKITLVHSYNLLAPRNDRKTSRYAKRFLERNGVKLMLGERFVSEKDSCFVTDHGRSIKSDLTILCTGMIPNSGFIDSKFLDKNNLVKVDEYLMAKENWFCCGDVASINEEKTAQGAEKQAKLVIHNLLNPNKMKKYSPKKGPTVISLGKYDGIFEYEDIVIGGIIPRIMKSIIELKTMVSKKL